MKSLSNSSHEHNSMDSMSKFRVRFSTEELAQLARELHEDTIADVHLSLLTYWICASKDNYEEAKIHIRELSVDQGYLTDRIKNQSLRKLLAEARSMRPRYEPDLAYADIVQLSRHSSTACSEAHWPKRTSSLLSSSTWPRLAPGFSRTGVLQERKSSAPIRGTSPWPTISESGSLLKPKRTPIVIAGSPSSASLSSSFLSPSSSCKFPPCTPDRPAPLNIKSRESDSTTTTASMRTVSTPLYSSQLQQSASSPFLSKVDRTSRRLFSLRTESLNNISENTTSDDIFADEIFKYRHHRDSSVAAAVENDIRTIFGRSETTETKGTFALMPDELSDTHLTSSSVQSAYQSIDSFQQNEYDPYRYKFEEDGDQSVKGDVFGSLNYDTSASTNEHPINASTACPDSCVSAIQAQYSLPSPRFRPRPIAFPPVPDSIPSPRELTMSGLYRYENEDEIKKEVNNFVFTSRTFEEDVPVTNTTLCLNDQAYVSHPQYSFPNQQIRPLLSRPESVSSISQRRAAMQICREARSPNPVATSHFHRPLPLRSYESDAHLYPTFRTQAKPSLRRSISVNTSPVRRGAPIICRRQDENEIMRRGLQNYTESARPASQTSISPSETSTLIDGADVPRPRNPIADAYKSVTSAFIGQLLQQTRERGAQLPSVKKRSFSIENLLWRDANEHLIMAIYGRKDIDLSQTDRDFVNKIAKEMDEGIGTIDGYEWFRELFMQE